MSEGRSEAGGLDLHVRLGVDQAGPEDALGVRRQLAAHLAARRGRGDPVELVEEPGDGVALRVELEGPARLVAQEEEADELRRQQVGHLVGRRAAALRRAHLAPADVEELVGHVGRRLAIEDLAADGVAAVAAATLRGEVLAAALDGDVEVAPLGRPVHVEGQLGAAAEGRHASTVAAAGGPAPRSPAWQA